MERPFIAIVIVCVKLLAGVLHGFIYGCISCKLSLLAVNWDRGLLLKHSILFVIATRLFRKLLSIVWSTKELKCFRLILLIFVQFTCASELFYRLLIIGYVVRDLRPAWSSWRPILSFNCLSCLVKVIEDLGLRPVAGSLLVH